LKDYNFNYNYEIFDQGKRIPMDKPNIPVLPEYLRKIVDSLEVRSSKVGISLAKDTGSQQNIQLQAGNVFGMLG
jgi:hypothetical protein